MSGNFVTGSRCSSGGAVRGTIRANLWPGSRLSSGEPGHLAQELAPDFLRFCQHNPKPCPLIDVTEPGKWELCDVAPGSDIRTDVPLYRVYRQGCLTDEPTEITHLWRHDLVAFLLGCSFSFEAALQAEFAITHSPGCMFVTDQLAEALRHNWVRNLLFTTSTLHCKVTHARFTRGFSAWIRTGRFIRCDEQKPFCVEIVVVYIPGIGAGMKLTSFV